MYIITQRFNLCETENISMFLNNINIEGLTIDFYIYFKSKKIYTDRDFNCIKHIYTSTITPLDKLYQVITDHSLKMYRKIFKV